VKVRFARELFEHEGRMCLDCGYPLEGLPDEHNCPECGEAYETAELRALWMYWLTEIRSEDEEHR
jgi:rubrerythrin